MYTKVFFTFFTLPGTFIGFPCYHATYTPQLFDLQSDPEELNNIAVNKPQVVQELDAYLRSVVGDYFSLDKLVVQNDKFLFKKFFY